MRPYRSRARSDRPMPAPAARRARPRRGRTGASTASEGERELHVERVRRTRDVLNHVFDRDPGVLARTVSEHQHAVAREAETRRVVRALVPREREELTVKHV